MSKTNRILSLTKGCMLLEEAAGLGEFTLSEISRAVDWPSSTTERFLNTFIEAGFIDKKGNLYSLGMVFARFWKQYREQQMAVVSKAQRNLEATEIAG